MDEDLDIRLAATQTLVEVLAERVAKMGRSLPTGGFTVSGKPSPTGEEDETDLQRARRLAQEKLKLQVAQRARGELAFKSNPYHVPSGTPEGGQFTSESGATIGPSLRGSEREHVEKALSYFKKDELKGMSVHKTQQSSSRIYATSKGSSTYLKSPDLARMHPAFTAGVLYHENVHRLGQKGLVSSAEKELDAHSKTKGWAFNQLLRNKDDPAAKRAFQDVYEQASQGANAAARMRAQQRSFSSMRRL